MIERRYFGILPQEGIFASLKFVKHIIIRGAALPLLSGKSTDLTGLFFCV
ncbi:hypothetical protein [Pedobacter steynii]